jgi:hypothetical protein
MSEKGEDTPDPPNNFIWGTFFNFALCLGDVLELYHLGVLESSRTSPRLSTTFSK